MKLTKHPAVKATLWTLLVPGILALMALCGHIFGLPGAMSIVLTVLIYVFIVIWKDLYNSFKAEENKDETN